MASQCDSKRSKCSGLKRGPQYGFWIWCTLIKYVISLPCIFSLCLGVDLSVSLRPEVVFVRYGDPMEIFCIVENNAFTNYTSQDLEFTIGGKHVPSQIVNDTTIQLYIQKPEKQVLTYYCMNKKTGKKCPTRVVVDSPPMNVTDFKCISKNLEVLNCSWSSAPNSGATISYSLTFLVNGNAVPPCKPDKIGSNFFYCTWNTSSEPRYRQQEDEYFFILKASNKIGENSQNFTIDHFSIVKPDPPTDIILLSEKPHSIVLKWNISNSVANLLTCGVEHRIEYQIAKIDNKTYFHSVDTSRLPPNNKTYKFLLKDLPYSFMQYEVRIYIKSKKAVKEEFWSDFTYKVFHTASEIPRRPPELTAGAFSEAEFHEQKMIWVYWKQLEEYEEAGQNFTYKVLISQGNENKILYPDKNKSLSYVELTAPWEPMQVTVWSKNEMGVSENSSHLYIPSKTDSSLRVTTFTQLAYEGGTYKLSWVGKEKIDNYTLFWCQYNVTLICAGRMNFTILDATKNSYEITLPKDHRYQFAISANNGTRTSGIIWATCAISKDSIPMYGFPVTVKNDAPGKSFVRVTWTMACTLQERIITGYLLKYCVVVNTSNFCDPSYEKKSTYIPNPEQMSVNITDLLPHKTYLFTLDLNTTYGLRTVNASRAITTTEDTPTSPRNVLVTNVESNSLILSWDPPYPRNGIIGHYVISNYGKEIYIDKVDEDSKDIMRRNVTLKNLISFQNYSLTITACNTGIHSCSKPSPKEAIFVRTKIGPPSRLKAPIVKNNPDILKWDPPEIPGGTRDLYQIRKVKDDTDAEIMNTTNLSYQLTLCQGVIEQETYQIRAVNFDYDEYSGVIADTKYVKLPPRKKMELELAGEWSEPSTVTCRSKNGLTMTLIFMTVFALIAMGYGSIKLYKKYRKMGDIKPVLPDGLSIPEKDTKYSYGGWNPANKDEKPSSDEILLLPNSKGVVPSPDVKQKDNSNCGSSDHTDSTVLSDTSRGPVHRQASTSDESTNSSLNLVDAVKVDDHLPHQDEYSLDNSDIESFHENPPYFNEDFGKNQAPVVNPSSGYVEAVPSVMKNPPSKPPVQPAGSSYVMASLSPPIFTTGIKQPNIISQPPTSSGYMRHDDAQIKSLMNLPNLGLSPTKVGPDSLPAMPSLPQPAKHGPDSSYIQLQSLDAIPSLKPTVRNTVPLKPQTNGGYVSPNDPIINKHSNIISSGQPVEESAILDPTMSPDAYCRFSWSTDPAKDNLHSFYSPKN